MKAFFLSIIHKIRPDIPEMEVQQRRLAIGDVLTTFYTTPIVVVSLIWLLRETNLDLVMKEWRMLLLLVGLYLVFEWLTFFMVYEIRPEILASSDGSLDGIVIWSGLLLFGPIILWVSFFRDLFELIRRLRQANSLPGRWVVCRAAGVNIASSILPGLFAIRVYTGLGGQLPISGLLWDDIYPAFAAVLVNLFLFGLILSGYLGYIFWAQAQIENFSMLPVVTFVLRAVGFPYLAYPFGILAAGVYAQNSFVSFIFFMAGLVMVAYISRQLSRVAENNRQRTRQLEKLEQLSRAIITGLPDASTLPAILTEHVPGMFTSARVKIWIEPDDLLFIQPQDWDFPRNELFTWIQGQKDPVSFPARSEIPWLKDTLSINAIVVAPIQEVDSREAIGYIYVELLSLAQLWDYNSLSGLYPVVQTLAAQITSAIHQADIYHETLDLQRSSQELKLAGEIQMSFFPDEIPTIPGWELAVTILPARETSGDFFDFIPLEGGRLGILIADVTDKGFGPALYMALSRTLIRTYAIEYEADPDVVFFATNERILNDARANLFVTAFYGILDPETGILTYSNAGHNPPYLVRNKNQVIDTLKVTGMPIGMDENIVWQTEKIEFEIGDYLLLYTDGIPDALNENGDFFNDERLLSSALANISLSALEIQAGVIEDVNKFVGTTQQVDDITLMVLSRNGLP